MISRNWLDLSYSASVIIKGKSIMAIENGENALDGSSWRNRIIRKMIMKKRAFQSLILAGLIVALSFLNQANAQTIFTSVAAGPNNWNVAGTWTQSGPVDADGVPDAGDFVTIATGHTVNMNAASFCSTLTMNGSAVLAFTANQLLQIGGNYIMDGTSQVTGNNAAQFISVGGTFTVPGTGNIQISGISLSVSGTTTITGSISFTSDIGVKTFGSAVTNNGSWTSTSIVTAGNLAFRNGVSSSGTLFTAGSASFTVNTAQSIGGAAAMSFANAVTIGAGITVTNNNTSTVSMLNTGVALASGGAGSAFVQGANSTLIYAGQSIGVTAFTATAANNTVNYSGTVNPTTIALVNYTNLIYSGSATGNLGISTTISGNLTVLGSGILNINGAFTIGVGGNLTIDGTSQITGAAATSVLNITGTLSVPVSATNTRMTSLTFTVTGATTIAGTFTLSSNIGVKTFTGAVSSSGSWTSTAVTTAGNIVFKGGVSSTGSSFTAGSASFNTNSQAIGGTAAMSFANTVTVAASVTVTNNNANIVTMSNTAAGSLTGLGSFTQGSNSTLIYSGQTMTITAFTATASGNTVNYNGSVSPITITNVNYYHLIYSGSATTANTGALTTTISGNLNVTGSGTLNINSALTLTVSGNLSLDGSGQLTGPLATTIVNIGGNFSVAPSATNARISTITMTVTGISTISGIFSITNDTGVKTFTGAVTNIGSWTSTSLTTTNNLVFKSGISNSGTFAAGTATFNTSSQTLSGSGAMSFANTVTVTGAAVTLTNNNTSTVTISNTGAGALAGTGIYVQGANSTLLYAGSTITVGTFTPNGSGNTVNFTGATPTVPNASYYHLTYSGSSSPTITSFSIAGNLTMTTGTFTSSGTITFNGATDQTVNATSTLTFSTLTLSTSPATVKVITDDNIQITTTINFTAGILVVGSSSNVTLTSAASFGSAGSASSYIQLDGGTGSNSNVIKTSSGNVSSWRVTYPIGTATGGYTPISMPTMSTNPTSGATLSVKAIYNSSIQGQLRRTFRIVVASNSATTTWSAPVFNYSLTSDVSGGDAIANYNTIWYLSTGAGTWTTIAGTNAGTGSFTVTTPAHNLVNGTYYYTIGTSTAYPNTWYSYQTGVWSDWTNWTLDPSGTTLVNGLNLPPQPGDEIVILNGITITNDVSGQVASNTTINSGATLDMSGTTSNTLGTVSGAGTLRINGVALPTGTYTSFVASTGGTIEYYDAGGTVPTTTTTYNNLKFTNSSGSAITYITAFDLTVNGTLNVTNTGSSTVTWQINDGTATNRTLSIKGDLIITAGGKIKVGSGNSTGTTPHNLTLTGNFTNNGNVQFLDPTDAVFTSSNTTGAAPATSVYTASTKGNGVTVTFSGTTDQTVTCNNQTDFYRFVVNKGTDQQAILVLNSSSAYNFRLFGPANLGTYSINGGDGSTATSGNALSIANGTLEITGTVTIPLLVTGGSCTSPVISGYTVTCNNDFGIPQSAALWLNGAGVNVTVADNSTSNSNERLLLQGFLRITNGTLNLGYSKGLNSGSAGTIIMEGGALNAWQIRPIANGPQLFSYVQTGGTVTLGTIGGVTGVGSPGDAYARFSIPNTTSSFQMSGGTLNINTPSQNSTLSGSQGIDIQSSASNYNVTGGTVNIYIPSSSGTAYDFGINMTAPIYDLNIYSDGTTGGFKASLKQSLTVLHNLTIDGTNSPTLNCNSNALTIGGNLTINTGATLTPGAITLNGSGAQTWTHNGTITSLTDVTMNKASGTLTLAGSQTYPNITGTTTGLTLTSGTLADGGKTITVTGNLTNSATVTGTGVIFYNNAGASTIGGSAGTFSNLSINTNATIATSGNQTISGSLRLLSASTTLNIASYSLTVYGGIYSDATTGTAFTSTKRIITAGLRNDGGLIRQATDATDLLFPVATGTISLSWITLNVDVNNTTGTSGLITVRPVQSAHPNVAVASQSVQFYWRITSSGFTGISAVTHSNYRYGGSVCNGASGSNYRAARFDPTTFTWSYSNATYDATSGVGITQIALGSSPYAFNTNTAWTGVTGSKLDGEYTAGTTTAFGTVTVYYSRTSGNWGSNTTWSTVGVGGTAASSTPCATCPTVIGDATHVHTVSINANSQGCGSLYIDSQSTLDCGAFTSLNFGATTSGTGTLRISSNVAAAVFPAGDFLNFLGVGGGTVEWYGANTTAFTIPAVGPTPQNLSLVTYNNLIVNAFASQTITMPPSSLTIYSNLTKSGTGTLANDVNASRTYAITGDLNISAGTFNILTASSRTTGITLTGNLSVSSGATFAVSGGAVVHTLSVNGNITNNGVLNFSNGSSMNVTFGGTSNASLTGTTGTGTTLNLINVNKGTSQTPTLTVDVVGALTVPSNNWLTLTNGTFNFSKSSGTGSSIVLTNSATNTYTIPSTAKLKVSAGTVTVSSIAADDSDLILNGGIEIAGGTLNIGSSGNNNNNDIEYASAGTPTITVSSGTLYVNGSIRRPTTTLAGALVYNQTGGTVTVGGRNALTSRGVFEIESNTGSSFTFTGTSALNIVRTTSTTSFADLYLNPVTSSVASTSTITMGLNTSTAQAMSYNVSPSIGNFSIVGGGTGAQSVTMYSNDMNATGTVSICSNCTLTTNSLDVYVGKDLSILGTYNGSNNTTTFNGTTTQAGTLSTASSFLNMAVNNTGGSTVSLSGTAPTLKNLNILNGTLDVGSLALTVSNDVINNSSQIGTGSITIAGLVGTTAHTITSSNGSFTNLILGGTATTKTVTVTGNLTILGTLTFSTTNRYLKIGSNQLTFGTSGAISGAGSTAFIKTNGVSSDLGVVKTWPVGTTSFTYAVGTRTNYTPVTYSNLVVPSGGSGTLTVIPVDDQHPTSSATGEQLLSYYWIVTHGSTLVYGTTGTQVYQFPTSLLAGAGGTLFGAYLDAINLIGWTSGGVLSTVGSNTLLTFTNSLNTNMPVAGGEFDYSCGTTNTLPNPVLPVYSRFADADGVSNPTSVSTLGTGGSWNLATNWTNSSTGNGAPLSVVPSGRPVVILSSARINMSSAGLRAFTTTINGLLVVTTTGHNLGNLSGTGTMRTTTSTLPAGNYTNFVASTGGTIEYVAPMTMNSRTTYNNLTVSGSGVLSMTNTDITLNGTMTIGSGTTLNNGFNNNINVSKNWANSGTFTQGTGTVSFIGTTASTTSGTTAATFYNLTMNKTGADLTPGGTLTVNNILTMTGGNIISTAAKKLTLSSVATTSGGSSSSFVIGPMDKVMLSGSSMSYPVGAASASRYRPVVLANTTADDTWTVEYVGNDPSNQGFNHLNHTSPINKVSMFEYWNISRLGSTASDVTLTYNTGSYLGSDIGNVANLYVVHWNTATSSWEIAPGGGTVSQSGTNIAGTVTTTNQTSFSPDAIGSLDLSSPLPVTWLAFTGNRVDNSVVLEWATAQERNNDHFEIQRSIDGKTFDKIGTQVAVGNSSTVQRYKFTDREVLKSATYYYRIKQVDVDGQSDFSKVVVITGDGKSLQRWAALPNPTNDNTHFHIQIMDESVDVTKPIQIQIISSNGVIVYEGEGQTDQLNKKLDSIMQSFGQGIYIVQISDGTYRENFRIARM